MTTHTLVYQEIARLLQARANCQRLGNAEWFERHTDRLLALVRDTAPSGAGIDRRKGLGNG